MAAPPAALSAPEASDVVIDEAPPAANRLGAALSAATGAAVGNLASQALILGIALPALYGVDLGIPAAALSPLVGIGMGLLVPLTSALGGFLGALPFTSALGALGVAALAGGAQFLLVPSMFGAVVGALVGLVASLAVAAWTRTDVLDAIDAGVPTGGLIGFAAGSAGAAALVAGISAALFAATPAE